MSTIAVDDPLHANPSCPCFNQHGMKIGLVLMDPTSDDFVKTLLTGAQRAADDRDLDLVVYSAASFDIGAQQAAITSMVQRGVTSLIVQIPVSLSSMAPVPILKGLAGQGIRIGSIVAGEAFTSSPDFQPAFHVGNDNYQAGVLAATKLLNAYPAFAANTVCFNPISGLSNFDLRCSGWITTMKAAGKTASQIGAYGKSESLALIQQAVDSGTVKAMFMAGAFKGPAIDAVRGTPGAIGRFLVIAFELDSVTGAELQVSDVVPFIVDTQPYLQGYTAVTLSAAYNLTETDAMATRFFRTGPVIVDQTTPNLARRVQLQSAGYPVCPSVDHPTICFNRTAAVVNNVMNAQTYNGFWSIVRSGLYEAAVDTGVQVHEWLDNSATDTKMAAYLSTLAQQEVQRRDASAQPNATSPMIGVVVAAAGSWTHAAAAIDALHAAVQVPVMGINKVLVGSQTQHSYDSYMLMSNQEAGRQAAQFAWKHGYTKMTCFHETSVVDWTSSDARCYVAESTFRALGGQASYIRVDPQNANTIAQAVAQAIQNGTQIVFSETSAALSPTIDALKASGVYGIGAGKVTAASIGDTNAYMLAELDAGRYLFGVHQSAFLQGYLPTCLFFARAVTGGYTDGNRLLPDPSATFDGTSVTYPIINAGPVIITSASSRYVNCSSALNGPTMLNPGPNDIRDFGFQYVAWPRCDLKPVQSGQVLQVNTFSFSSGHVGSSIAVSAVGGILAAGILAAVGVYRKRAAMKSGSVRFTAVLVACTLAILSLAFLFAMPASRQLCSWRLALFSILVTVVLSVLFAKMLRVYRVFANAMANGKKASTSDVRVLRDVLVGTSITVIIVILTLAINPPDAVNVEIARGSDSVTVAAMCQYNSTWKWILYGYLALVVLLGCYISYKSWDIPSSFNEARFLTAAFYVIFFTGIVIIPLTELLAEQPQALLLVNIAGMFMATIAVLLCSTGPKLIAAYKNLAVTTTQISSGSSKPRGQTFQTTLDSRDQIIKQLQAQINELQRENAALRTGKTRETTQATAGSAGAIVL